MRVRDERALPPHLRQARDALFVDADRHGPRLPVLLRRSVPGLLLPVLALAAASSEPWRATVINVAAPRVADLVLVLPMLVALVVLGWALAPLARVRAEPLVGAGMLLLVAGLWATQAGMLVAATLPAAVGATLVGIAAARAVRRAVWALPVLLAAGVSDAQSVEGGVTSRLLEGAAGHVGSATSRIEPTLAVAPELVATVDLLVLHVPAATGTWLLGLVDVLAVGLLLGLAHLFWLPLGRTAVALAIVLGGAVLSHGAVPVLPLLGVAWVLVHARLVWRSSRFSLRRLTYLGG